jgi:hypothetical protein
MMMTLPPLDFPFDPLMDLSPIPRPLPRRAPAGLPVSFAEIALTAGMTLVTTGRPPEIRIHDGPEDFYAALPGRSIYCLTALTLPDEPRVRAREILRRLSYGFLDYTARETVARARRDMARDRTRENRGFPRAGD